MGAPIRNTSKNFGQKVLLIRAPCILHFLKIFNNYRLFLKIIFSEDGETFQELGSRSIHGHVEADTLPNYNGRPMVVGGYGRGYHKKSELLDVNKKEWEETSEYPWGN